MVVGMVEDMVVVVVGMVVDMVVVVVDSMVVVVVGMVVGMVVEVVGMVVDMVVVVVVDSMVVVVVVDSRKSFCYRLSWIFYVKTLKFFILKFNCKESDFFSSLFIVILMLKMFYVVFVDFILIKIDFNRCIS